MTAHWWFPWPNLEEDYHWLIKKQELKHTINTLSQKHSYMQTLVSLDYHSEKNTWKRLIRMQRFSSHLSKEKEKIQDVFHLRAEKTMSLFHQQKSQVSQEKFSSHYISTNLLETSKSREYSIQLTKTKEMMRFFHISSQKKPKREELPAHLGN